MCGQHHREMLRSHSRESNPNMFWHQVLSWFFGGFFQLAFNCLKTNLNAQKVDYVVVSRFFVSNISPWGDWGPTSPLFFQGWNHHLVEWLRSTLMMILNEVTWNTWRLKGLKFEHQYVRCIFLLGWRNLAVVKLVVRGLECDELAIAARQVGSFGVEPADFQKMEKPAKTNGWNPQNWWFGSMFLLFPGVIFRFQPLVFRGVSQVCIPLVHWGIWCQSMCRFLVFAQKAGPCHDFMCVLCRLYCDHS